MGLQIRKNSTRCASDAILQVERGLRQSAFFAKYKAELSMIIGKERAVAKSRSETEKK